MKRDRKRLSLNRESVRQLTNTELKNVAGGIMKTYVGSACSFTNNQCNDPTGVSIGWCGSNNCPPETAGCVGSWQCD